MRNEHRAIDNDLVRTIGHVDDQVAADDVNVGELDANWQRDHAVGPRNNPFGIGEVRANTLDPDRKVSGVVGAEAIGQRIGEGVGYAFGAAGVARVGVISLGIDPDHAKFASNVQMSAGKAGVRPARTGNRGDDGVSRAKRVGAGRSADRTRARDRIADRRCARSSLDHVIIVVRRRPLLIVSMSRARLGQIFVAHNPTFSFAARWKDPRADKPHAG